MSLHLLHLTLCLGLTCALAVVSDCKHEAKSSCIMEGDAEGLAVNMLQQDIQQRRQKRTEKRGDAATKNITKTYGYSYDGFSKWTPLTAEVDPSLVLGGTGKKTFSQVGQDWLVQSILGCKENGFFLELAAFDPEYLSNSLMLERDFNWNGLCVEANPNRHSKFAPRKCTLVGAAVGSPTDTEVKFEITHPAGEGAAQEAYSGIMGDGFDNNMLASGDEEITMRSIALADLLEKFEAPAVMDYFSLDVEGAESVVMEGFPWDKYTFKLITVERPKDDLLAALKQNGYELLGENSDWGDQTWIHSPSFSDLDSIREQWNDGSLYMGKSCMQGLEYPIPNENHSLFLPNYGLS